MKKRMFMLLTICVLLTPLTVLADGYCPLGPDVTRDLYGALKIFNIVAPVLCIGFSVYEAVKAVSKGDASSDMKKIASRFGRRVVYTIILIFLPILVDQMMQIADVWGVNGTCDLSNPSENGTDTTGKYAKCAAYDGQSGSDKDKNACESAGCSFNWSTGECYPK